MPYLVYPATPFLAQNLASNDFEHKVSPVPEMEEKRSKRSKAGPGKETNVKKKKGLCI